MKVNEEKVRKKVIELAKLYGENVLSVRRTDLAIDCPDRFGNNILVVFDYSVGYLLLYDLKNVFELSDLEVFGTKTGVEIVMDVKSDKFSE